MKKSDKIILTICTSALCLFGILLVSFQSPFQTKEKKADEATGIAEEIAATATAALGGHVKRNSPVEALPAEEPQFTEEDFYVHGETYYIQAKVLEWGGYPEIRTVEEYAALLNEFVSENPVSPDGAYYIAYLEPEDEDYDRKIKSGRVLGLYDTWDHFGKAVSEAFAENGMKEEGCDYVPLALKKDAEDTFLKESNANYGGDYGAVENELYRKERKKIIDEQSAGFSETLSACFDAYGAQTYPELAEKIVNNK